MINAGICYVRKLEAKLEPRPRHGPRPARRLRLPHVPRPGFNFIHCQYTITTTNSNIGSEIDGVQAWNSSNYDK